MTQSGQGNDPQNSAAGPAREGIVMPGGGDTWAPDQQAAPPAGQPWGQPWGPGQQPAGQQPGAAPIEPQPYGQGPVQGYQAAPQQPVAPQQPHPSYGQGFPAPQMPPQAPAPQAGPPAAAPQPPAPGDHATTVLPPLGGRPNQPAPGGFPPQQQVGPTGDLVRATPQTGAPLPPAAGDHATTVLPPLSAGAAPLPPEAAPRHQDAATQMLRPIKAHQAPPAAQPMPGADAATQLIPPVPGAGAPGAPTPPPGAPFGAQPGAPGDRPTPSEFDGLFRDAPAESTAQLPRFDDAGHPPYGQQAGPGGPFAPGGGHDRRTAHEDGGSRLRKLPPAVIIGAIVVALAGVGLGVGWALSGGGSSSDSDSSADTSQKQQEQGASKASAPQGDQPKPAEDPAAQQAKALDALLADSNNSRAAVVGAVQNIKGCNNLDGAAGDLRSAAGQRNDLVKRLQQLTVDKIPNNAQLTAALTTAWQSSAAADNHYAAWADKVGGKGGCKHGHAKGGKEAADGNAASGAATKAKQEAAGLWNPIAQKYGLQAHQPEQL
ncbi:hypothetical protein [Streptomyces sp. NPDC093707]|uniref:hypothetical protein n=1 Tax=Streptomyces sp. NPDC093707 TaxID=3154984 RepID=UPI00344D43FF